MICFTMLYLYFAIVAQPAVWQWNNFLSSLKLISGSILFSDLCLFSFHVFFCLIYLNTLCCNFHNTGKPFFLITVFELYNYRNKSKFNKTLIVFWKYVLFELSSSAMFSCFATFFCLWENIKKQNKYVLNFFLKFDFIFISYWN